MYLSDSYHRKIDYLRLSLLDACNFRCNYCLPEVFTPFLTQKEWLSVDEIKNLVEVLSEVGINKIRLTGGEPTLRKDFLEITKTISEIKKITQLHLTTNASWKSIDFGNSIHQYFDGVNISFDSLNEKKFEKITQSNDFSTVWNNVQHLYELGTKVKLNVVVMKGINENELLDFVELTKNYSFEVRFLETMPFDGKNNDSSAYFVSAKSIFNQIAKMYGEAIVPIENPQSSTSKSYKINNYKGNFGIIPAFSRTFCSDCNRVRITAKGEWVNCLYQNKGFNVKELMRNNISKEELKIKIMEWVGSKPKDGFEAEKNNSQINYESMSMIGG